MAPTLWINTATLLFLWGCTDSKNDNSNRDTVHTETDTSIIEDTADQTTEDTSSTDEIFGDCGDGIINSPYEECDDGENNANSADACRTDCLLPKCGDGIIDSEEECDDSNLWNVDGCDEECKNETGDFEVEPNDNSMEANLLTQSGSIRGMLWEGDEDCYTFEFADNDYISFTINPEQDECSHLMMINIYEDGEEVGSVLSIDGTCSSLDPLIDPEARFLPSTETTEVTYCVEGLFGTAVEEYTIQWEISSNSCSIPDPILTETEDVDADTLANNCDNDDDGDGLLDTQDNCPLVANNGETVFVPTDAGFIMDWVLSTGFQVSGMTMGTCQTIDGLFQTSETDIQPSLTIPLLDYNEDSVYWHLYNSPDHRVDFNVIPALGTIAPPREVFAGTWVYSDTTQSVDVKFGPDDAGRVWVNGTMVGESQVCQGASADKYTFPTTLNAGWNRVMVQVHDNGGGWAFYFRFMEAGTTIPIPDLTLSPVHTGIFQDYQMDSDGDGVGDQCDLFD
jgi:cysteine-rich repeat protein